MHFAPSRQSVNSGACGGYCEDCGQTWDYPTCRNRLSNYAYPRNDRLSVDDVSLGTFYPQNRARTPQLGYFVPFYENIKGGMPNNANNYYESPLVRKR